ncbi:hypothetical protein [Adhaeribacter pallidiroseus]|uniref:Uncharacterized protein n=1 Tax=Adhaeribacter pallidiroseus TaxID=2072847 RepID=A0A369QN20_9BACT|nr:hypothetical protein [Adhaeribacter pallidiroseus]RDC65075.1 hypothetical protein AHMF7616_03698 [Adhaeribacter pallidiroseus]
METPQSFIQKEVFKNIEEEIEFELIESFLLGTPQPTLVEVPASKPLPSELLNIFTPINQPPKSANQSFILPGGLGKFLGRIEDFEYAVVLRGDKGAGKTSLLYQIKNLFATVGKSVASFTLEIGKESNVVERLTNKYIAPKNRDKILISSIAPDGLETIRKAAQHFDVIAIDSWSKLNAKQEEFDKLRKECPKTMFIVIFQSTTGGTARGGSMAEYDAGTVIQVDAPGIAKCEKNRYALEQYLDATYEVHKQNLIA